MWIETFRKINIKQIEHGYTISPVPDKRGIRTSTDVHISGCELNKPHINFHLVCGRPIGGVAKIRLKISQFMPILAPTRRRQGFADSMDEGEEPGKGLSGAMGVAVEKGGQALVRTYQGEGRGKKRATTWGLRRGGGAMKQGGVGAASRVGGDVGAGVAEDLWGRGSGYSYNKKLTCLE